ncbi:MAG TPA: 50S ribosomal protein L32 [bacterium]|nr:50S ribosomal protein L32 [bacterium]
MTPLPKQKITKARAGKRRAHQAITPPAVVPCPQCGEKKRPHRACPTCGTYNGEQVIEIKAKKKK